MELNHLLNYQNWKMKFAKTLQQILLELVIIEQILKLNGLICVIHLNFSLMEKQENIG
jgi:hypothetical protein